MHHIRVLIVGRHALLRDALTAVLSAHRTIVVVGQTSRESEAPRLVAETCPDVVLLEPSHRASQKVVTRLRRAAPETAVLVVPRLIPSLAEPELCRLGAHTCLPVNAGRDGLVAAVTALVPSRRPESAEPSVPCLSPREQEVLSCVESAMTNQQIAHCLDIATGTVKAHLHSIFRKLDAVSRLDAVTKAAAYGLLP
ncbi:response regulator transcription factor [Streptomyces sp. NPDC059740]|uniref:response regulator transcription factor n=1 Tax=Streptomyces sp. NPDC059740 TaxID=3346926 RepID=UPI00364EA857